MRAETPEVAQASAKFRESSPFLSLFCLWSFVRFLSFGVENGS